jgi:hypothetical protein
MTENEAINQATAYLRGTNKVFGAVAATRKISTAFLPPPHNVRPDYWVVEFALDSIQPGACCTPENLMVRVDDRTGKAALALGI